MKRREVLQWFGAALNAPNVSLVPSSIASAGIGDWLHMGMWTSFILMARIKGPIGSLIHVYMEYSGTNPSNAMLMGYGLCSGGDGDLMLLDSSTIAGSIHDSTCRIRLDKGQYQEVDAVVIPYRIVVDERQSLYRIPMAIHKVMGVPLE